jgi:hypothetical protein
MSELTDKVRRMLSQAQVFARDTPFEAVSRARQALEEIDAALASAGPEERSALDGLRKLTVARQERYQELLDKWLDKNRQRGDLYNQHERSRITQPLRARG